jgi:large subunit ribosomal protein L6
MSRIGKNPVVIPAGVKANVEGQKLFVDGPKGKLEAEINPTIAVAVEENEIKFTRPDDEPFSRSIHGTSRSIAQNMVKGVTEGYTITLELIGVGYRAEQKGKDLNLVLGFSHHVYFPAPEGIQLKADSQTKIIITGIDKQIVGQTAADIRKYRRPEPYKGKGILYLGEQVRRKQGKRTGK